MKDISFRLPKITVDWEDEETAPVEPSSQLPEDGQDKNTASTEVVSKKKKRGFWSILLGLNRPPKPQRSFLSRLIGLKIGQFINLFIWSALVGLVMKLTNFNPLNPQFDATATAGNVWQQGLAAVTWAVKASWQPALTGATIIIPLWFAWRVISLPFRR